MIWETKVLHSEADTTENVEVICSEELVQRASVETREVGEISVRAREAPRVERRTEVARPMPEPAPVIRMTFPVKGREAIFNDNYNDFNER